MCHVPSGIVLLLSLSNFTRITDRFRYRDLALQPSHHRKTLSPSPPPPFLPTDVRIGCVLFLEWIRPNPIIGLGLLCPSPDVRECARVDYLYLCPRRLPNVSKHIRIITKHTKQNSQNGNPNEQSAPFVHDILLSLPPADAIAIHTLARHFSHLPSASLFPSSKPFSQIRLVCIRSFTFQVGLNYVCPALFKISPSTL